MRTTNSSGIGFFLLTDEEKEQFIETVTCFNIAVMCSPTFKCYLLNTEQFLFILFETD